MATTQEKIEAAKERLKSHPGGENLVMISSKDKARELQKKSVESRRRNKERIQGLRSFWKDFDKAGLEIGGDDIKGVDVMTFLMKKAFHDEDFDLAFQYAEKLAQYQTPKLASQQVTQVNRDLSDLSDEEFQAELAKLEAAEAAKKDS